MENRKHIKIESVKDGNTYSLLLIDDRNGDSDMITDHKTAVEIRQLIADPKYRTHTIVAFPISTTADADGSSKSIIKTGQLTRSEKLAKLKMKLGIK